MSDKIVLYDETGQRHYPAPDGYTPDVLSKQSGNYLRFGNDMGIFADGNDILSNEANNMLGISDVDGKLMLARPGNIVIDIDDYISHNECSKLTRDSDGKLAVMAEDFLDPDNRQLLEMEGCNILLTAENLISDDAGNKLSVGLDKRLYVSDMGGTVADFVCAGGCNYIAVNTSNNCMYVNASTVLSDDAAQLLHTESSGCRVLLTNADLISTESDNRLQESTVDGKLYVPPVSGAAKVFVEYSPTMPAEVGTHIWTFMGAEGAKPYIVQVYKVDTMEQVFPVVKQDLTSGTITIEMETFFVGGVLAADEFVAFYI